MEISLPELDKLHITAKIDDMVAVVSAKAASTSKNISSKDVNKIKNLASELKILLTEYELAMKEHVLNQSFKKLNENLIKLNTPTYANIASKTKSQEPINTYIQRKQTSKKELETLIISANSLEDTDDLFINVSKAIDTMRSKKVTHKINKVIKGRKSVILKIPDSEDIDHLITLFKKFDEIKSKSKIYKPSKRSPNFTIKNVNKITSVGALISQICHMNTELNLKETDLQVEYELKSFRQDRDVIIRCSPSKYQNIINKGFLHTSYECCPVKERVLVRQCQNCFAFNPNHRLKDCKDYSKKLDLNNLKCPNCAQHNKFKTKDLNHKPNNPTCPLYKQQIDRIIEHTDYSGEYVESEGEEENEDQTSK